MFHRQVAVAVIGLSSLVTPSRAQVQQPEPPSASKQPEAPATPAAEKDVAAAKARVLGIINDLKDLGITLGQSVFSLTPLMVDGKPATAIVIGDIHTEEGGKRSKELIEQLGKKYGIKTIILEGSMASAAEHEAARSVVDEFNKKIQDSVISPALARSLGIGVVDGRPGYAPLDYKGLGFEREIGSEGTQQQDFIRLSHLLHLHQSLSTKIAALEKGDTCLLTVDGKPSDTAAAFIIHAPGELQKIIGIEIPALEVKGLGKGTIKEKDSGAEHPVVVLTGEALPDLKAYFDKIDLLLAKYNIDERNKIAAQTIARALKEKGTGDLVLVVIGLAHTVSTPDSLPSLQDRLDKLGVSCVGVFPKKIKLALDEKTKTVRLAE